MYDYIESLNDEKKININEFPQYFFVYTYKIMKKNELDRIKFNSLNIFWQKWSTIVFIHLLYFTIYLVFFLVDM